MTVISKAKELLAPVMIAATMATGTNAKAGDPVPTNKPTTVATASRELATGLAVKESRSANDTKLESKNELTFSKAIDRLTKEGILSDDDKVKSDFDERLSLFVANLRIELRKTQRPTESDEVSANRLVDQLIWLNKSKLLEEQSLNNQTLSKDDLLSYYTQNPSLLKTFNGIGILREIIDNPTGPYGVYSDSVKDIALKKALDYRQLALASDNVVVSEISK